MVIRPTSRTAKTERRYSKRLEQLVKRCGKEGQVTSAVDFVEWLIGLKPTIGKSTWRQYKAAGTWYLERRILLGNGDADTEAALDRLRAETQEGTLRSATRTSSRKPKGLPDDHRQTITGHLSRSRSPHAPAAIAFLNAGTIAGLREIEWAAAELFEHEDGIVLCVRNAKSTNGRSHGELRHLTWAALTQQEIEWIRQAIAVAAEAARRGELDALFTACQRVVREACVKLWRRATTRRYTLSSARHQFLATAKLFYSREEVAALAGHLSDATASCHYGRRSGKGVVRPSHLPTPDPAEVARVRRVLGKSLERLQAYKEELDATIGLSL